MFIYLVGMAVIFIILLVIIILKNIEARYLDLDDLLDEIVIAFYISAFWGVIIPFVIIVSVVYFLINFFIKRLEKS